MNPWGLLFIAIGLFAAGAGVFDWDWYMNSRKARFLRAMIGRMGARIFYTLVGSAIFAMGLAVLNGIVEFKPS